MRYFIFRNSTVENLFGNCEITYSGYDDTSFIPDNADSYIWFFQVLPNVDKAVLSEEIDTYFDRFRLVHSQIPPNKTIYAFTLADLFPIQYTNDDFAITQSVYRFNFGLISISQEFSNIKVLNIDDFFSKLNKSLLLDWKYYFISRIGINPKLAPAFSKWFSRCIEEIQLRRKKCLVLDLDNTLWGGILGEDGIEGIKIGGDYPGNAFLLFQKGLAELSRNGIILTICSKNNESDVLEAWENNPFIVLNRQYFSAYRINWKNKVSNIEELAEELNIGLESFVFVDDNPMERDLVKQKLPMIEVPEFPSEPYELPLFFQNLVNSYFRIYSITDEDRKKSILYKTNLERAKEKNRFIDLEAYLASLNINIEINRANEFNIMRIAQMTQKTNQFNLTTIRYTESELIGLIQKGLEIYCIDVSDRFGDDGITGAIIIDKLDNIATIDSFLLSCRILGKGIEEAFLITILNMLSEQGIEIVKSKYIASKKNMQVSDFYEKYGFEPVFKSSEIKEYQLQLANRKIKAKSYHNITLK